jgi:hypothetical protein
MSSLYEQDFYQWTIEQANLLRAGALSQLDIENLIEEVESMGRSEKRELEHRLTVLITHLLKWDHQPERRGRSWENTIRIQRIDIRKVLKSSPGLNSQFEDAVYSAYEKAVIFAADETGLPESSFPETCPYTIEKIMGD